MQLELQPPPPHLAACLWARRGHTHGLVLAVPEPLPVGLSRWLRQHGWELRGYARDRGQAAVLLAGGDNAGELLSWVPAPRTQGSNTAGNLLPW